MIIYRKWNIFLYYCWPYERDTYMLYFCYRRVSKRENMVWWCIESISISHPINLG
jgi:hypothetical protein